MTTDSLNVIIYSKDRPAQLDLLLQSFAYSYNDSHTTTILYKASNSLFKQGYEKTIHKHQSENILFVEELNFKNQTLNAIHSKNKYTMFLVDDIMFINKWSLNDEPFQLFRAKEDAILCVSLRLGHNTTYCYPISSNQSLPKFVKRYAWNWTEGTGDFGYPMSLDGNVYVTKSILEILNKIDVNKFVHPNLFESELNSYAQAQKFTGNLAQIMLCYEHSRLFNNPCNRVQNVIENKTESSYSPERLCEKFINDHLDMEKMLIKIKQMNLNAAHYPMELIFHND